MTVSKTVRRGSNPWRYAKIVNMFMDIVTVTCNRDIRQTLIQAESIQKFVSPCRHWVIVNQWQITESHKQRWRNYLKPFYTKHKLVLYFPEDLTKPNKVYEYAHRHSEYWGGFKYQFLIAPEIQDDYLVLNAKNFFIKPSNIEDFRNIVGSSCVDWDYHRGVSRYPNEIKWHEGVAEIEKYFGDPAPELLLSSQTPAVVNYKLLTEKIKDFDKLNAWYDEMIEKCAFHGLKLSDWHFYSFVVRDLINKKINDNIFYRVNWPAFYKDDFHNNFREWKEFQNHPKIKMTMFHKLWLSQCSDFEIDLLNIYLRDLGLKTPIARVNLKTIHN